MLTVPTQALHGEGDSTYVHKMADGRRVKTAVRVGTAYGPLTEILSGLAEGDEVEVAGFVGRPGGNQGGDQGGKLDVNEGPKVGPGDVVVIPGGGGGK